jgi:hypothetical protein
MPKEVGSTINSVGRISIFVGDMDAHTLYHYDCMILRHLHQGYGFSWVVK